MAQINKPTDYFNTVLYAGTDSAQSITGVGFQPDFTWIKVRNYGGSASFEHVLTDAVRGANKTLTSNSTEAEATNNATGYLSSFDSDGFSLAGGSTSIDAVAGGGRNYVAWNWLGANASSSNTDGSITSNVSANTTSGFSIVGWTGSGANATIGHGLGVAPKMIIIRRRTGSTTNWIVYHESIGNNNELILNLTNASTSSTRFQSTSPTSSVFSVSSGPAVNESSQSIIAYCFAEKKGFSKFGSYTGNGSTDGTFVYTGFRPAFVMIKHDNASYSDSWIMMDNTRNTFNVIDDNLKADLSNAEETNSSTITIDFLSNGFKCRGTNTQINRSGDPYYFMCFAENPLVGTNNIPTTAR